jgi:FkbM family methyltransferase
MHVLSRACRFLAELKIAVPLQPVLVDVGANIGTTTVIALRRHGFATGLALEPSPAYFRTLRLNVVVNDLEGRVTTIEAAASDREEVLRLDVRERLDGTHRIRSPAGDEETESLLEVKAITLDGLTRGGLIDPTRVGLVWIDTSGYEARVLAGASTLLEHGVPVVSAVKHRDAIAMLAGALAPHYTDFVELRFERQLRPLGELGQLDLLTGSTDILAVCR